LENFRRKFANLLVMVGTTYRQNYETFSALLSTSNPLTLGENTVQIDA